MMAFGACLFLIPFAVVSIAPSNLEVNWKMSFTAIEAFIQTYFIKPNVQEIEFYFCNKTLKFDQLSLYFRGFYIDKPIGIYSLSERSAPDYLIGPNKAKRNIGIFLDLSCPEGLDFLRKSSNEKLFGESYSWLMWMDMFSPRNILNDLALAYDSDVLIMEPLDKQHNRILLRDVYKVHYTTDLILSKLAVWIANKGLIIKNDKPARNNLYGYRMNSIHAIIDFNDTLEKFEDRFYYPDTKPTPRYTISWFLNIAQMYNFSYNYTSITLWGSQDQETGQWTGLLGVIQRGEVELSMTVVHIRKDRMQFGIFVTKFVEFKMFLVFLQPAIFGTPLAIIRPLSTISWLCLAASLPLAAIVAKIFSKYDSSQDIDSWSSILEFTIGNLSQQGPNDNMQLISSRIMALTFFLLSFFVTIYYSAAVLSGLLSPAPKSINSLDKLMDSPLSAAISDIAYFKDFSTEGVYGQMNPNKKKLLNKLAAEKRRFLPLEEGVERVKNDKFAFLVDDMVIFPVIRRAFDASQICSMDLILYISPKVNLGMMMRKNTPYREIFSQKLLWQEEVGLKYRNKKLWVDSRPVCIANQQAVSISIEALCLAFYMLTAGFAAALAIFLIEFLLYKHLEHKTS